MEISTTLIWVVFAAFLAPVVVDILPIPKVPVVVVELLLGALLGPHLIDLIREPENLHQLQEFGVIFLFFLAGFEVDMAGIRGGPLRKAAGAWVGSIALAIGIAFLMQQLGIIDQFHLVAIAMATTALGPIMPMLADQKLLGTKFGNNVISIGALGEFAPVLLIAFLLNQSRSALTTASLILAFGLVCLVILRYLHRMVREGRQNRLLRIAITSFKSTSQFAVRMCLLILILLVFVAQRFELDVLLGAFAAGFIIGQMGEVATTAGAEKLMERLLSKLETIGFGLFIPMFFVLTGANLNLPELAGSTRAWIALPLVVIGSLLIRGLPTMLLYRDIDLSTRFRLSLMASTQLPLVATLMTTYVARDYVPADIATAIIIGCVITVAVFPLLAFAGFEPDEKADNEADNSSSDSENQTELVAS